MGSLRWPAILRLDRWWMMVTMMDRRTPASCLSAHYLRPISWQLKVVFNQLNWVAYLTGRIAVRWKERRSTRTKKWNKKLQCELKCQLRWRATTKCTCVKDHLGAAIVHRGEKTSLRWWQLVGPNLFIFQAVIKRESVLQTAPIEDASPSDCNSACKQPSIPAIGLLTRSAHLMNTAAPSNVEQYKTLRTGIAYLLEQFWR